MISSTANSRVKQVVVWQTKAKERKKAGIFIVEGIRMYEEAPESWIKETYVSEKFLKQIEKEDKKEKNILQKLASTGYEEVTEEVFSKMSDTQSPQGILCVLQRPTYNIEEMLLQRDGKLPLLLILEDLQDPGNLGTILRTGEGAGINGVIMSRETVDIYNPKTIRSTMGSVYRVPHVYVDNLGEVLKVLKEKGVHTYAAHLVGKTYYDAFDFKQATAFLIGNEGNGLRKETADLAESYLKIPMEGKVESLNAAMSAGLLAYEAHRQRNTR
ncbi:MAG: RNA methyltransferase [Lachnospiraceae bacterium]|nr:RNA methyltransferase [Lachnospiraceae bacterium]